MPRNVVISKENILNAYEEAVKQKYRFELQEIESIAK